MAPPKENNKWEDSSSDISSLSTYQWKNQRQTEHTTARQPSKWEDSSSDISSRSTYQWKNQRQTDHAAPRQPLKWEDSSSDISSLSTYQWKNQRQTKNAAPQQPSNTQQRRDWGDLSSTVSSLDPNSWRDPHQTRDDNASMHDQTANSTAPHGGAATNSGDNRTVHFETEPFADRAAATDEEHVVDAPEPMRIGGRPFTGPVDTSGNNFPSGLADIQLPPLPWKGQPAPGFRVPEQLIAFGKDKMRWEADRDLPRDDAFHPYLPDREQSFVGNHYIDHMVQAAEEKEGTRVIDTGPMLYEKRPPSPKLPTDVLENLQSQTAAFVGVSKRQKEAVASKREELKQAHAREDKATKTLEKLRAKNKKRLAYRDMLRQRLAERKAQNASVGVGMSKDHDEEPEASVGVDQNISLPAQSLDGDQSGVVLDRDVDDLEELGTNMGSEAPGAAEELANDMEEEDMSPKADGSLKVRRTRSGRVSSLRDYFEGLDVGSRSASG